MYCLSLILVFSTIFTINETLKCMHCFNVRHVGGAWMKIDEESARRLKDYYHDLKKEEMDISSREGGVQKCPVFENVTEEAEDSDQVETCAESEICTTLHVTLRARFDLHFRSADAFFDLVQTLRGCTPVNKSMEVCDSVLGRVKVANLSEEIGTTFSLNTTDCYVDECNNTDICNYSGAESVHFPSLLLILLLWTVLAIAG